MSGWKRGSANVYFYLETFEAHYMGEHEGKWQYWYVQGDRVASAFN